VPLSAEKFCDRKFAMFSTNIFWCEQATAAHKNSFTLNRLSAGRTSKLLIIKKQDSVELPAKVYPKSTPFSKT